MNKIDYFQNNNDVQRRTKSGANFSQNINKSNNNIDKTIEEYKPKIFWKDKPVFKDQMNKLSYIKLNNILQKVGEAEKLIKTSSFIRNDLLMKNLLLSISKEATTSS